MREIEHWIGVTRRRKPREVLAILSASMLALMIVACIGCLAVGIVAGTIFVRQRAARERDALATASAVSTQQARWSDATRTISPTAPSVPTLQAFEPTPVESPEATATAPVSALEPTPDPLQATPSPEPPVAQEPNSQPQPTHNQVTTTTIEPMNVPAPDTGLALTQTSQLTLSSVIFVENAGQFPDDVRFQVRGPAGSGVWLGPDAIWLTQLEARVNEQESSGGPPEDVSSTNQRGVNLKLSFAGSNPAPQLVPLERLDTHVSYFAGNDPASWHSQVPVWGGVRYQDLYPGIDLEIASENGMYVQRLVVRDGADLSAVRLRVEGAQSLALVPLPLTEDEPAPDEGPTGPEVALSGSESAGERFYLRVTTELGDLALPLLSIVSQDGAPLPSGPRFVGDGNVLESPFLLPREEGLGAEKRRTPSSASGPDKEINYILYSTFLGQGGSDASYGLAVDDTGSAVTTGRTYFPMFPLQAGPFDVQAGGDYDVSLVKFKPNGKEMAYVTFVGGAGDEEGRALDLDRGGNAYVAATSSSADLPITPGAFAAVQGGGLDSYLFKLNADGTELQYATFLGGSEDDWAQDIAVDSSGNAYVVGSTRSADFPATTGAWDTIQNGQDAFVTKVNALGTGLGYSTLLGGTGNEQGNAIVVDNNGQAYVVGTTESPDFPTEGATIPEHKGDQDAFVAQVNASGTGLVYATFLGGSSKDQGNGVALDPSEHVYVVGSTQSPDFPATAWGFDASHNGGRDAFIVKLVAGASELEYASFAGYSGDDWGQDVTTDDLGYTYVTGSMQPLEGGVPGVDDAFVLRLNELGTKVAFSTLLGGSGREKALHIDIDPLGSAYVIGSSASPDSSMGPGASPDERGFIPQKPANIWDGFLVKVAAGTPFLDLPVSYSNFARAALGNMNDQGSGRVNSWFDHGSPNHTRNQRLVRWDGRSARYTSATPPLIGESWYDGHGGIDFRWDVRNEPIYAAAPGTVIDMFDSCQIGDQSCGDFFGNRVWIDHGNGYATVYAHLDAVHVSVGTLVNDPAAQSLGTMGNTGRSQGTHLHLGLYYDRNGDGGWTKDEVVDPYGWAGSGRDPWPGPHGSLWRYPLHSQAVLREVDVRLAGPSRLVTTTIPAAAFGSAIQTELLELPSDTLSRDLVITDAANLWRSAGRTFRLQATRLDSESSAADGRELLEAVEFAENLIALTVAYRAKDISRLDPTRLTIRRWDTAEQTWMSLPTTVDASRNQVVASTTETGKFDLHAPLLCATDIYEPDDHYASASAIPARSFVVRRSLDIAEDQDWFRFEAEAGTTYLLQTNNLAAGLDTILSIHNQDTLATLISSDSRRNNGVSDLKWRALQDGSYLLRIQRAGSSYGCDATYTLTVRQVIPLEKVAIAGPEAGTIEVGYAFTATVSPLTSTQPISYSWQLVDGSGAASTVQRGQTLTFTWSNTGTHRILAVAENEGGAVTSSHSFVVHPPLIATFEAWPISGEAPLKVNFTNSTQGHFEESLWDFGDGKASKGENPTHTYKEAGTYTITLTVQGPAETDSETKVAYVTVEEGTIPRGSGEHVVHLPIVFRLR